MFLFPLIVLASAVATESVPPVCIETIASRAHSDSEKPLVKKHKQPAVHTIDLKDVWAYGMPNTKKMRAGLPKSVAPESPLLREIRMKYLLSSGPGPKVAGLGFVVDGEGITALVNAHAVFLGQAVRKKRVDSDREVTLVFFSKSFHRAVHLTEVIKDDQQINLFFRFVPFEELMSVDTLALIPLGKLTTGEYQVQVHQLPMLPEHQKRGYRPLNAKEKLGIVAKPFSFIVEEPQ